MSAADLVADGVAGVAGHAARVAVTGRPRRRVSTRLLRSELGLVFGRRRNQLALVVLAGVPILIGTALKLSGPSTEGPAFFARITHNGAFLAFASLVAVLPLFLPLAVSVVAGDAVSGEAQSGTLRYLLAVPVGRTRLLVVKYTAIVTFCLASTVLVAAVGAAVGLLLFPAGSTTLLSATPVSTAAVLGRLLLVALYVGAGMAAVGAIGLLVSVLTETPVAAMATTAGVAVLSEVLDAIPQLHAIQPYLVSHYWLQFGDLLRDPIATTGLMQGLAAAAAYAAIFGSLAWARFGGKDVSG
ncbi:MAG: ABC transporter permease [Actinobacteria bacterium]|nr:ABC transporter permease [Actinomycetota bacterium]MBI3688805.1 ABC transporter permease [Actinomycetota bacterium]